MARTRAKNYLEKRGNLLHQAAQLFAQHGYTGTSITMIAAANGVSKALIYHYYTDKEAVLFDILHTHLTALVACVDEAAASAAPGGPQLLAIGETLLEAYRDAHAEHQVQIANLGLLPEASQQILRGLEQKLVGRVAEAISEIVPGIVGTPALKPLTMAWFGMINWHYLWFREGRVFSRADYARMAAKLVIAGGSEAIRAD
jgi:AcrR family transcriptional regulator